jgi:sugar phosphate isomerase/epimerase
MARIPIALQVYTVRDVLADDFVGTIAKVAEMGYAGIETGGTGPMAPSAFKLFVDDLGLRIAGNHTGLDALEKDLSAVIDLNHAIGNSWIVVSWMPEERRADAAGWRKAAATMGEIGAKVKEAGLQLCYHNHSFEFQRFEGKTGFDIFYGAADPSLVHAEIDTYWVQHGGEDPAATIARFKNRVPLVHVKDMLGDDARSFAEVGEGILDWQAILAASEAAGAKWYIVEQDVCQRPSLESARLSLENLKAWGVA